jgi:hypothetical protein
VLDDPQAEKSAFSADPIPTGSPFSSAVIGSAAAKAAEILFHPSTTGLPAQAADSRPLQIHELAESPATADGQPQTSSANSSTVPIVPPPQEAHLPLAGFLPLDLTVLQQGVDAFFTQLGNLGRDWPDARLSVEVATWLAVASALVLEGARLRRRTCEEEVPPGLAGFSPWENG